MSARGVDWCLILDPRVLPQVLWLNDVVLKLHLLGSLHGVARFSGIAPRDVETIVA